MKPTRDGKRKHTISKSSKTRKGTNKKITASPPQKQQKFEPIPRIEPKFINATTIPSTFSKYNTVYYLLLIVNQLIF